MGKNGCGKSTLLSLLKGEIAADGGSFTFPATGRWPGSTRDTGAGRAGNRVCYRRRPRVSPTRSRIAGGQRSQRRPRHRHPARQAGRHRRPTIRSRAASLLHGLGFSNEQLQSPVRDFSGGWRMRLNRAGAGVPFRPAAARRTDQPPDLDAVIWLERWLKSYPGTLVLIRTTATSSIRSSTKSCISNSRR